MTNAEPDLAPNQAATVRSAVSELWAEWRDRPAADAELRRRCREELARLRAVYRRNPALFDAELVGMLQNIAKALGPGPDVEPRRSSQRSAETPLAVLEKCFGYRQFRPGQLEIIETVLAGRDCVGVMPTGAGKSLTYQIPARLLGGLTLVVSPLIALMKDQVDAMTEIGLRATFLNSSLTAEERRDRSERVRRGEYELVYAAPEGLQASAGWALSHGDLRLIAVDEAHCISHWGHDFRPAYRALAGLKRRFGDIPVLALTATATDSVIADIVDQLAMRSPAKFRGSFFRSNLRLSARKKGGGSTSTREAITRLVLARRGQSGIIYCLSRKSTEATAEHLAAHGARAAAYHAGMDVAERSRVQDGFRNDEIDVVVATIAFGMGIDKSNVRYVIHRDMPRSIEGYYQEIGRAGRDGLPSDCVLFYSWADVIAFDRFLSDAEPDVAERQRRQAREMFDCADHTGCRHQRVVGWFGESIPACGTACDVCTGRDPTAEAVRGVKPTRRRKEQVQEVSVPATSAEDDTLTALKVLRKSLADQRKLPAYVVFSDATLLQMLALRPQTEEELLAVSGVGPHKLATYGRAFLEVLRRPR